MKESVGPDASPGTLAGDVEFSTADEPLNFVDVWKLSEAPVLGDGLRYFDIIGGEKNVRCFVARSEISRGQFLAKHADALDKTVLPVYQNMGITVRQDTSCALPGFYIVAPDEKYDSIVEIDRCLTTRLFFIVTEIRRAMLECLGIEHVHIYYEEKAVSAHVHFWLLPIVDIEANPRIYDFDVKRYMDGFVFSVHKDRVADFNDRMRVHLATIDLVGKDDRLRKAVSEII